MLRRYVGVPLVAGGCVTRSGCVGSELLRPPSDALRPRLGHAAGGSIAAAACCHSCGAPQQRAMMRVKFASRAASTKAVLPNARTAFGGSALVALHVVEVGANAGAVFNAVPRNAKVCRVFLAVGGDNVSWKGAGNGMAPFALCLEQCRPRWAQAMQDVLPPHLPVLSRLPG